MSAPAKKTNKGKKDVSNDDSLDLFGYHPLLDY
jgi:hypothetical protein